MVKQLIALKTKMAWNTVKNQTVTLILSVFALLGFMQMAGLVYFATIGLALLGQLHSLAIAATLIGSIVTLLWILVPLIYSGIDDTLDPRALATFLPPTPRLATALVIAGGLGPTGVATIIILLALPLGYILAGAPVLGVMAVAALALSLLTAWTWVRAIMTGLSVFFDAHPRAKDWFMIVGALAFLAAISPLGVWISLLTDSLSLEGLRSITDVVAWTPFGAPWGVIWSLLNGTYTAAFGQLLVALLFLGVGVWAWSLILPYAMSGSKHRLPAQVNEALAAGRQLVDPKKSHSGETRRVVASSGGFFRGAEFWTRLGVPTPAASLAARTVRDWVRDPRVSSNLAVAVIFPFMTVMITRMEEGMPPGMSSFLMYATPVIMGSLVGALPSYDSTAFWVLVSCGISGRHERLGRLLGSALVQVPLITGAGFVCSYFFGYSLEQGFAFTLFTLCLYAATAALSLLLSTTWVYPVQPPGASPLSTKGTGNITVSMFLQFASLFGSVLVTLPVLVMFILANVGMVPFWASALVSGVWTVLLFVATPFVAGPLWEKNCVKVLSQIRSWPGH